MDILSFAIVFIVPLTAVIGALAGGAYTFLTPFVVFVLVPIIDIIIGADKTNPATPEEAKNLEAQKGYRILTWICGGVQIAVVFWGAAVVSFSSLTWLEFIGVTFSIGVTTGAMGITVAHELAHRVNNRFEPLLSRVMLWTSLYMHWAIEHVAGHHRTVATPEDPATARRGESFYKFWPRTVAGGFNSAWEIEARRIRRKGKQVWSLHNRMALYLLAQGALLIAAALVFGPLGLIYIVAQSVVAFTLLEVVNYVEHYGLLRKQTGHGKYEPTTPRHSWNSSNWFTNRFLFNLQRHSDHHYKPGRRYQALRHFDESPQLPTGYAGMLLLALVPPLWRKVMDHRLESFLESGMADYK